MRSVVFIACLQLFEFTGKGTGARSVRHAPIGSTVLFVLKSSLSYDLKLNPIKSKFLCAFSFKK